VEFFWWLNVTQKRRICLAIGRRPNKIGINSAASTPICTTTISAAPIQPYDFLSAIGSRLRLDLTDPRVVFDYVYAVLHAPGYRSRYASLLKSDFPRLPLTSSLELFRALATLGGELVALHLMESPKLEKYITKFAGKGDSEVAKGYPRFAPLECGREAAALVPSVNDASKKSQGKEGAAAPSVQSDSFAVALQSASRRGRVHINPTRWFEGVPENVWNFHIGGYQVCEKWLKDRRGRVLSEEDIAHYQKIVVALKETIRLMAEIDTVIEAHGGWPGAFASPTAANTT